MNKQVKILSFLALFIFFFTSFITADDRNENIDLFLVLDKSLSMEEEIEAVKQYVSHTLIDETLIPGDFFVLIQFYGQAEVLITENVVENADRIDLKETVGQIHANGQYTDIGNALDTLKTSLEDLENEGRRKYLLLVTDGKQEAPEESKYYSPDGTFNHVFLENVKTIQKEGWKIHVLGIGTASAAKEVAKELAGGYTETTEVPTQEEITEITEDLLSIIEVSGPVVTSDPDNSGVGEFIIPLFIEGYTEEPTILIGSVDLQYSNPILENEQISDEMQFTVPIAGTTELRIPFNLKQDLDPGTYEGTLLFTFNGEHVITPSNIDVTIKIKKTYTEPEEPKGFFGKNIWIIPVIAVVVLGIAIVLILLGKKGNKGKPCQFRIFVDNQPLQKIPISLKSGDSIFLSRDGINFSIKEKNDKTVAEITYTDGMLTFRSVAPDWFTLQGDIPTSVLNEKINVKLKSGLRKEFYFKAV